MHIGMHVVDMFGNTMCMLGLNMHVICMLIPTFMTFNIYKCMDVEWMEYFKHKKYHQRLFSLKFGS